MNPSSKITPIDFSMHDAFQLALRRWWLIAVLVLVGGFFGWGFSRLHAPLYDAQALLVINIDYQQNPELVQKTDDHYTEDQIIGAANAVVFSTDVLDQVNAGLQARGISLVWEKYIYNLTNERMRSQYWLRVRDTNPRRAAVVVNLWAEKAYAALVEFHKHAVNAKVLREYLAAMSACPPSPGDLNPPGLCGSGNPGEIQQAVETATVQLDAEINASGALSPALTFSLARKASVPVTPVAYRGSLLLAAGALLGCAVGIAVANISGRYTRRKRTR